MSCLRCGIKSDRRRNSHAFCQTHCCRRAVVIFWTRNDAIMSHDCECPQQSTVCRRHDSVTACDVKSPRKSLPCKSVNHASLGCFAVVITGAINPYVTVCIAVLHRSKSSNLDRTQLAKIAKADLKRNEGNDPKVAPLLTVALP